MRLRRKDKEITCLALPSPTCPLPNLPPPQTHTPKFLRVRVILENFQLVLFLKLKSNVYKKSNCTPQTANKNPNSDPGPQAPFPEAVKLLFITFHPKILCIYACKKGMHICILTFQNYTQKWEQTVQFVLYFLLNHKSTCFFNGCRIFYHMDAPFISIWDDS